jgi:hypothetical protein
LCRNWAWGSLYEEKIENPLGDPALVFALKHGRDSGITFSANHRPVFGRRNS